MATITIGLPILFFIVSIISIAMHIYYSHRKVLSIKLKYSWIIFNILFLIVNTYILIVNIISSVTGNDTNVINFLSNKIFGFDLSNGFAWLIWIILWLIFIIGILSIRNAIKISEINNKVDELNRSVAITKGKLNKTLNKTSLDIQEQELTLEDYNVILANRAKKVKSEDKLNKELNKSKNDEN